MSGSDMQDQRKVQTAVLASANSDLPAFMPLDQEEAEHFQEQARHQGTTFWCGHLLGGCGAQLSVKIYRASRVVPHFAHQGARGPCRRRSAAADSADHLFAARHLRWWARAQGMELRPRYVGDFESGGGCEQLVLESEEGARLRVVFTPRLSDQLRELAAGAEGVADQWLVADNPSLVRLLLERGAPLHRIRLAPRELERCLQVGTVDAAGHLAWRPVEAATLTSGRLYVPPNAATAAGEGVADTPAEDGTGEAGPAGPAAVPQSRLRTALDGLEHALEHGTRKDVGDFSDRVRRLLAGHREPDRDQEQARRLLERSTRALGSSVPGPGDGPGGDRWRRQVREREERARGRAAHKHGEQEQHNARRRKHVEQELRRVQALQETVTGSLQELRSAWHRADWDTYRSTRAHLVRLSRMYTTPGKVEDQIRNALKDLPDLGPAPKPAPPLSPPRRNVGAEMKVLGRPDAHKRPEA